MARKLNNSNPDESSFVQDRHLIILTLLQSNPAASI